MTTPTASSSRLEQVFEELAASNQVSSRATTIIHSGSGGGDGVLIVLQDTRVRPTLRSARRRSVEVAFMSSLQQKSKGSSGGASSVRRTCLFLLLPYMCSALSIVGADGNEPERSIGNVEYLYYKLSKSCNGSELPGQPYLFHLAMVEKDEIPLEMKAAFFDDVCQPPGPAGGSSVYLSQYEVFQIAFVGTEGYYTQLEIGPYGHYLVILGSVSGSILKMDLTVSYAANVDRYRSLWRASLKIPVSYLPPGLKSMNAWARHGRPTERRVLALYPPPAGSPCKVDSTTVKTFGDIDVKRICPNYEPKRLSHTWKRAFEDYYWASSTVAYPAVTLIATCLFVQVPYRFLQGSV